MSVYLENLHYIVGILATLGGFALWVIRMHIKMIEQKMDMQEKFNREHADNCLAGLKEINKKLDKLSADISKHNAEYSAVRVEVDNIKEKVGRLEAWFGAVIEK